MYKATKIVCVLFQIFYYSQSLFESVGLTPKNAELMSLAVGGILVVMTLVSIPLMDRVGRRVLHLTGLGGMFVFSIVFTICYYFALRVSRCSREPGNLTEE